MEEGEVEKESGKPKPYDKLVEDARGNGIRHQQAYVGRFHAKT